MHVSKINKYIHLIDLEPAGIKNFVGCYVLIGENTAIVETGPASTVQNLLLGLEELGVEPKEVEYVAVTHIHLDHSGGAGKLMKHLPKAKLLVHPRGAPHMANPENLWIKSSEALRELAKIYGKPEPLSQERIIAVSDGMTFDLGNEIRLKATETLGHASHHIAYYEPQSNGVFTGDAVGVHLSKFNLVIPITPPPFRMEKALASLEKLGELQTTFLYFTHFGMASPPKEKLEACKRRLELWERITRKGIERGQGLEAIRDAILENDTTLRKAEDFIKTHPILRETVFDLSMKGVMRYVAKHRTPDKIPILDN